jgi:hypothetical protein
MSSGLGLGRVSGTTGRTRSTPSIVAGEAVMSQQELHMVFANLIEIAGFGEAFTGVLDGASGSMDESLMDDHIGEVFIEMVRSSPFFAPLLRRLTSLLH